MEELKGNLPEIQGTSITYMQGPQELRVLAEAKEHYVIASPDGKPSAIEKDKVRVVVISGDVS